MSEEIRYSITKIKSRYSWNGLAYWSICLTDSSVYFVLFGILRSMAGKEVGGALKDIEFSNKSVIQNGETLENILSRAEQHIEIPLSDFTKRVQYRKGLIKDMVFFSKKGDLSTAEEISILKMRHKHFELLASYTKNLGLEFKKVVFTKKILFEVLKPFLIILALVLAFFGIILFEDKTGIVKIEEKTGVMVIDTKNKVVEIKDTNNRASEKSDVKMETPFGSGTLKEEPYTYDYPDDDPAQSVLLDKSMFYTKDVVSYQSDDGILDGIVKYNYNGIDVFLDLNTITTVPDFSSYVGKVTEIGLSPNKKFLYITTAQGGGQATFIYDVEQKKVYVPDFSWSSIPTWLTNGRLYTVAYVNFGPDYNYVQSVAISASNEDPWVMSSLYSRQIIP